VDVIPVTAGQTYTAVVWLRGVSNYAGAPLSVAAYDQTKTLIDSESVSLTDDWTQHTVTFTPGMGVTHIALLVERGSGPVNVLLDAGGFMLVAGSSAPARFNAGDDLADAITVDVLALDWRLGLAKPYDSVSAPIAGRITVQTGDRRYAPEQTAFGAGLAPGYKIRVRATDDSMTHTLLTGWIDRVEPAAGSYSVPAATIHLRGPEDDLAAARVTGPLLAGARANTVIEQIIERSVFQSRYAFTLETGESVFAYTGDTWGDGVPAIRPIREATEAERGRFFTDRTGRLRFYNRRHLLDDVTALATFDETFAALDYGYGVGLATRVLVGLKPRTLGPAGSTLWTLAAAQRIPPDSQVAPNFRLIKVRLRDANGTPMGATTVITPVATTDYTANSASDGSGANVTGNVTLETATVDGSAVTLRLRNSGSADAWLMPGSKLRGTPLLLADPLVIERSDAESLRAHGVHPLTFDLPHLVTADEGEALARFELARRKRPVGVARSLTISADADAEQVLSRTLFDRIRVIDGGTGHDADYFIVAEAHRIDAGGARHTVTWTLEPANPGGFWQLNRSGLGQTTRLGYSY
jgi:hypothetical protein